MSDAIKNNLGRGLDALLGDDGLDFLNNELKNVESAVNINDNFSNMTT